MAPRSSLSHCLSLLSEVVPDDAATLVKDLPLQTILQSFSATGSASIRRRKLPAEQVVWLVLGMALFRHLPIVQIVDQLGLALPEGPPVAPSAIHKARQRLGVLPMLWLFEATAQRWAHDSAKAHRFLGLGVYGIDGTTLRVADSQESRDHFGGTHTHRGPSGYPLVRLVALMALRSHLLAAAAFGPYDTHELVYAQSLFAQIPDESLVILDRGFFSAAVFFALCSSGNKRHFLCRVRKDFKARTVRKLGAGDELCELVVSSEARRKHPELPETLLARRIVYQRKGFRPQALLTSLLDPKEYPQKQLAELYHDRWELELGFDEVKTEMLARQETPFFLRRQKAPPSSILVEQSPQVLPRGWRPSRLSPQPARPSRDPRHRRGRSVRRGRTSARTHQLRDDRQALRQHRQRGQRTTGQGRRVARPHPPSQSLRTPR